MRKILTLIMLATFALQALADGPGHRNRRHYERSHSNSWIVPMIVTSAALGATLYYSGPPVRVIDEPSYFQTYSPRQIFYWCDSPRGYYPTVTHCFSNWREVIVN